MSQEVKSKLQNGSPERSPKGAAPKARRKVTRRKKLTIPVEKGGGRLQLPTSPEFPGPPQNATPESWDKVISSLLNTYRLNHREEIFVTQYLETGNATEEITFSR